jgi:hypothetical protein
MFFELLVLCRTKRKAAGAMITWKTRNKLEGFRHGFFKVLSRYVAGGTEE